MLSLSHGGPKFETDNFLGGVKKCCDMYVSKWYDVVTISLPGM